MNRIRFKPDCIKWIPAGLKTTTFRKTPRKGFTEIIEGDWFHPKHLGIYLKMTPIREMAGETVIRHHFKTEGPFSSSTAFMDWLAANDLILPDVGWLNQVDFVAVAASESKMFSFITCTWNPLGGPCLYMCDYCWARDLIQKYKMRKYLEGPIRVFPSELEKKFTPQDFVFVQDMTDLMAPQVPARYIFRILDFIQGQPAKFLLLDKNPARYLDFLDVMPRNVYLGATIESDINYPSISKAPAQSARIQSMIDLSRETDLPLFVSVEPILKFSRTFIDDIESLNYNGNLWGVAVGYDNYQNQLDEPKIEDTLELIDALRKFPKDPHIFTKTIRRPWYELSAL